MSKTSVQSEPLTVDSTGPVEEVKHPPAEEKEVVADGKKEDPKKDSIYKTSLCSYFRKLGNCRHAEKCSYAHGEGELRPRPDGSWDPTSIQGRSAQKLGAEPLLVEAREEDEWGEENGEEGGENGVPSLNKCIRDLPLQWTSQDLNKLLTEKGLAFRSSRKRKRSDVAFVDFESEEQANVAKEKLHGLSVHSKIIKVVDAAPRDQKKNVIVLKDGTGNAVTKPMNICDVVTPLAKLPYVEQLVKKKAEVAQVLKKLVRNVRKAICVDLPLPQWVLDAKFKGGLCCEYDGIVASPVVDGYRNKCEFTIGPSSNGQRAVGFLLGNFREGRNVVMEPDQCQNVSLIARMYAKAFQKFVQSSELPVWDKTSNSGFWRLFTVREGSADCQASSIADVMLIVQVCSTGVEESVRSKEYGRMIHSLAASASEACPPLPLSALLVQDHLGISNAAASDAPLIPLPIPQAGGGLLMETKGTIQTFIHDHICNLRFRISPTAFFQVNTLAAEKLYTLAGDWAGLDSQTLLFDVCCGTGTIGLTLANRAGMVIGIEMNEAAVADARINADLNGIKNCRFVCGKAEDVMQSLLEEYLAKEEGKEKQINLKQECDKAASQEKFTSVVVLVDPPRSGLHPVVLKVLRTHQQICRLVYVSCNPESLLANAVELCTPIGGGEGGKGAAAQKGPARRSVVGLARQRIKSMPISCPFSPVKAVAVDLFPHTPHCEMVMKLER